MSFRLSKPLFEVRSSMIQGLGAFATRRIHKGTRIIEYLGERITTKEADARYDDDQAGQPPHVLLFTVDQQTVIDAGVNGNEARYINHSCEPSCQAQVDNQRVHILALRDIPEGEELTYDYNLQYEAEIDAQVQARYACHCGARTCRGTMLEPRRDQRKKSRRKA